MAAKAKHASGLNAVLFKALSNELRARILVVLTERSASPKEIAKQLQEGISNVSHHVRQLKTWGLIELVREERRRGAIEHYYKANARAFFDASTWEALPRIIKEAHGAWVAQLVIGDISEAMEEGTFENRPDRYLSRIPLHLDEKGWMELIEAHDDFTERIFAIQADSTNRLSESDEEGFPVSASTICFEMPSPCREPPAK